MTDPTQTSSTARPPSGRSGDPTDHAKSHARDVKETGKQQAGAVVDEAKSQGSRLLHEARGQARAARHRGPIRILTRRAVVEPSASRSRARRRARFGIVFRG